MRVMRKNKQKMYYSLFIESTTVYERDEDGNLIIDYVDDEGNVYYREAGTVEEHYDTPIEFHASISSELNELHARSFGVDQSSIYSRLVCSKGELPFKYGVKIWKESPVKWKDEINLIPDADSADYTVTGVQTEYMNEDWYLLQRNNVI